MKLHIFAAVAVLCCAFLVAKENNPRSGGEYTDLAGSQGGPDGERRSLSIDKPLAPGNSSSSSSSLFPFPTASLVTLQLRQSPGTALDARRVRRRRLSVENNYTYGIPLSLCNHLC